MAFPPRFLDELRERISISEIVGRRVRLQKKGREHLGLCPFHTEKTPSFTVSDDKGFYHCFGCGAHGDVISFLTEAERLSFPEAVEQLANIAGLEVPRASAAEREREKRQVGLHACIEAACCFFERQLRLPEGKAALEYLRSRGLDDDRVRRFRIGFAPERRGSLTAALAREGFGVETMVEVGLLKLSERGDGHYEYFRGRITFPITDRRGRVIAFGGRALGDQQPKYLNSPESPIFHKGKVLYGLDAARERVRDTGELVVVEGYMDVIALDRPGLPAAVAPLGTAITEDQIREAWRLAAEPTLCLDGDAAGQRAARRAAERALPLLEPGRSFRFAALPQGEDPDSLVRGRGEAAFREVLAASLPLAELIWRLELAEVRPDTPERRAGLQRRLEEHTRRISDASVRRYYRTDFRARLAAMLGETGGSAGAPSGWRGKTGQQRRGGYAVGAGKPTRRNAVAPAAVLGRRALEGVLAALLNHPQLVGEFGEFVATLELPEELDSLRHEILMISGSGEELDATGIRTQLERTGYGGVVHSLLRSTVYQHAPYARADSDVVVVRQRLEHIAGQLQRKHIEDHVKEHLGRLEDTSPFDELERIANLSAHEQKRRADDEGLY